MVRLGSIAAALMALVGCKDDLLDDLPDAANIDATDVPIPDGDWSCLDTPYPTTAPDPLPVRGGVYLVGVPTGGIPVEIRRAADDTLVYQGVTDTTPGDRAGSYVTSLATGGVAPRIYRKIVGTDGGLDTYHHDGVPLATQYDLWTEAFSEERTASFYSGLALNRDLSRGTLFMEALDCRVPPAGSHKVAGVVVEPPPGATVFYVSPDGGIDQNATATTTHGGFLIFNAPTGLVDIGLRAGPYRYRSWPVRVHANSWTTGPRHP